MSFGTSTDYLARECELVRNRIKIFHAELICAAHDAQRRKESGQYVNNERVIGNLD